MAFSQGSPPAPSDQPRQSGQTGANPPSTFNPTGQYGSGAAANAHNQPNQSYQPQPTIGQQAQQNTQINQSTNTLDSLFNQLMGPSEANYQSQQGGLQDQLGLLGPQYDVGAQGLNQNYQNQSQLLGLQQSDLATQRGALGRQGPLQAQEEALRQKGFDITQWMNQVNANNQRQGQLGSAAASGATNTQGNTQALGNIQGNLNVAQMQNANARQGDKLSFKESQAQLQDQNKNFESAAKRLGISGTQLGQQLTQGLQSLGLQKMVSVDQIKQAMLQLQQGQYTQLASILPQLSAASGVRLDLAQTGQPS